MQRIRHSTRTGLLALIAIFLLALPQVRAANEPRHEVEELPYGVALYHFFQQKYFSSIIDLTTAKQKRTLVDESGSAELLLGGLYLSYGMQQQAHEIFARITRNESGNVPGDTLAKAWFHIGKAHYLDADFEASKQALQSVAQSQLAAEYEAERLYMLAEIHMREQQYDEAMRLLDMFPRESVWKDYTRFNIGVRLVANEQLYEGALLLEKLVASTAKDEEASALRDRARLALAATHARLARPENAARYLENVKLGSPRADVALLGLGWLQYRSGDYDDAMQVWMELAERPLLNTNVLEARMLLPRVLEKQGEADLALAGYEDAVRVYAEQLDAVDLAVAAVREGRLSEVLKANGSREGNVDLSELVAIMGPMLGDYLVELLVSSDFTQAVAGYRELVVLSDNLASWERSMPSLNMILEEKQDAYGNRLAAVVNSPKFSLAEKLGERRNRLVRQFEEQLEANPRALLATEEERELMSLLERVRDGIDAIGSDHAEIDGHKERYRFLAGLLQWHIDTDYASRVWAIRKDIRELDRALADTERSVSSLQSVWERAPAQHQRYRALIDGKKEHIGVLKRQVEQAMAEQENRIRAKAGAILMQYRHRVEKYHERALFQKALAYEALVLKP